MDKIFVFNMVDVISYCYLTYYLENLLRNFEGQCLLIQQFKYLTHKIIS